MGLPPAAWLACSALTLGFGKLGVYFFIFIFLCLLCFFIFFLTFFISICFYFLLFTFFFFVFRFSSFFFLSSFFTSYPPSLPPPSLHSLFFFAIGLVGGGERAGVLGGCDWDGFVMYRIIWETVDLHFMNDEQNPVSPGFPFPLSVALWRVG